MKKHPRTQALLQRRRASARRDQIWLWSGATAAGTIGLLMFAWLKSVNSGQPADSQQTTATLARPADRSNDRTNAEPHSLQPAQNRGPEATQLTQPSGGTTASRTPTTAVLPAPDGIEPEPRVPTSGQVVANTKVSATEDALHDRATTDAAAVRGKTLEKADLCQIAGSEGKVNAQILQLMSDFKYLQEASNRVRHGNLATTAEPDERQQMRRLLFEATELMTAVDSLPDRYDLLGKLGRMQARGHLLIHLATIESLPVPEPIKKQWQLRIESTKRVIDALGCEMGTEPENRAWAEASRLLRESAGLVDKLRSHIR